MASDVVIRAEHLGKKYIIGHQSERESYTALRDVIARSARSWARSVRDLASGRANVAGDELEEFWALKDVNFEIRRGDVVGVIGRNGAGKSTLLKVLSRITEPSEGRVEIRGRVASLLEVGTGFHPELTGRENIYLNGAILGMSRAEIKAKFDEIVAFAEIDKFLDTPVKRYSSGMYVRLAFAVAAHLEPEILIVDEVLAVGDAEFQKKCLGKMQDVAGHGRTVLFVSHNMGAINRLCRQAALLSKGQLQCYGTVNDTVAKYLVSSSAQQRHDSHVLVRELQTRSEQNDLSFTYFTIEDGEAIPQNQIRFKEAFKIRFGFICRSTLRDVMIGFSFVSQDGREILGSSFHDSGIPADFVPGSYEALVEIAPNLLAPGNYTLRAAAFRMGCLYQHIDEVLHFSIVDATEPKHSFVQRHLVGDIHHTYRWQIFAADVGQDVRTDTSAEASIDPRPIAASIE